MNGSATTSGIKRLPGADNIRVLGLLAVFSVHVISVHFDAQPRWLVDFFRFGTELFLVLSGCLIYRSVQSRPMSYGRFIARRALRIYPVFAFILILYFALSAFLPSHSKFPSDLFATSLMVIKSATLIPLALGANPIITVSWTLGYICLFYLVVHPIFRFTKNWPLRWQIVLWVAITAFTYFKLGNRAALLPLGVLLSELIDTKSAPAWIPFFFIGALARPLLGNGSISIIPSMVAVLAFSWYVLPRFSAPEPAKFLSQISYSFYLTHGLAILAIAQIEPPSWAVIPLSFAAALVSSIMVYNFVERPFSPLSDKTFKPLLAQKPTPSISPLQGADSVRLTPKSN